MGVTDTFYHGITRHLVKYNLLIKNKNVIPFFTADYNHLGKIVKNIIYNLHGKKILFSLSVITPNMCDLFLIGYNNFPSQFS